MNILRKTTNGFLSGRNLDVADTELFLDALIAETDESLLTDVFRSWNTKGIAENEIYSIARIMRDRVIRVNSKHKTFVDIVGTGGSRSKTFNVSTAAAFVVAGAAVPVAKHGNKAATSNSGSADVLSELGINPAVDPETAEKCLNEIGICFMFAPNFHRLSPVLAKVRRGLGFPTIFNCVGPLCNPASAPHQLIGVWNKELLPKMADALARLGTKKSWVVYGEDGLDEISLAGSTHVAEIENGAVRVFEVSPEYFGFKSFAYDGLRTSDPTQSSAMILNALNGDPNSQAAKEIILLNASAALFLSGVTKYPEDAAAMARKSLDDGLAIRKLEELAQATPA